MSDVYTFAAVLTILVFGTVITVGIRNWFVRRSAELDAGIKQVLDPTDPQMETRIVGRHRKQ